MAQVKDRGSTRSANMTARDFLAEISRAASSRPSSIVVHGPPGIGKTSFGAWIPGCLFLHDDKEDGISALKDSKTVPGEIPVLPPMSTWEDLMVCLRQIEESPPEGVKALVIDTLGGCERLCHESVCRKNFNGDWGEKGFSSYQRGYEVSLPEWRLLLNALDRLRDKGIQIVGLMHSSVRPHKNPLGEDFDRYVPDMHAKTWSLTHRWADLVLFLNYHVEVADVKGKAKGRGGQRRVMHTEFSAAFEAKNRFNLPPEIEMGATGQAAWKNLRAAIKEARS